MSVIIETSIGDITIDLYTDQRPRCSNNFLKLCKMKYYNFSLFHTVQQNLMAQTGDPTGTGRGGESIFSKIYGDQARFFEMEMSPRIKHTRKGLVSMVNNGHDMHGSQFFITLADNLDYLDGKHTVFGEVVEGSDVLEKLNNTFCDEDNRPFQDIRIYHTVILDDPYDDPHNLEIPSMSPFPTEEMLNSDHIACDANIDEDKDKTEEELAEMIAEKEAKANTQILEMVGDLPDVDVAPPENVLFVCKLNPVTTSEDLEIIFSRFGPIVNCDVIKDSKTGESLQYAFIEFENPGHCESAYFKMDNVLIDDRRIHVDFSQSVSKLKWKGKGQGVEIMSTGDAPIYVLKNQERQHGKYDLVYEHDEANNDTVKDVQIKKRKIFSENENKSHHKKADSLGYLHGESTKKHKKVKGGYSEEKLADYHRRSRDREEGAHNEQDLPRGKFKSSREKNSDRVNRHKQRESSDSDSRIKRAEGSERNSVKRNKGKNNAADDTHRKQSNSHRDSKLSKKRGSHRDDQDISTDSSEGKRKKHGKHTKKRHS